MRIRCPRCGAERVLVNRGMIARHREPDVHKTWAKAERHDNTVMIDVRLECQWSGASATFPQLGRKGISP